MVAFTRSPSVITLVLCIFFSFVSTHTVITYPGWRGNNLHTNGTELLASTGGLGVGPNNTYPYGMQWMYPCGGMPLTTNRTKWPVNGGAIAMQPGWFPGHSFALFYINLGENTVPGNFSLNMVPAFQIAGPSNNQFDGSFCLPQVPLPANFTAKVGDNATIQVVEAAQHGAALYSCVDITFAEPADVEPVTPDNCFNSSNIGFNTFFTVNETTSAAIFSKSRPTSLLAAIPLTAGLLWGLLS